MFQEKPTALKMNNKTEPSSNLYKHTTNGKKGEKTQEQQMADEDYLQEK